ncbi:hypothetical protein BG000_001869 [Podila horticola]|nr:hypothetical protein BG000_001869 [Podila horticola]
MSSGFRKPCIKTLEFSFDWSVTECNSTITQSYDGADAFNLSVRLDGTFPTGYTFTLSPTTTFAHSYTIKTPSGSCLATLAQDIPRSRLELVNGRYQVDVCLSSRIHVAPAPVHVARTPVHVTPAPPPPPPEPTAPIPATSFLDRLYHDVDNRDVSFILSPADSVAINESHVKKAHKLVLYQWPYFKRMFSSDFMEGGAGEKDIQVKDVKPKAFQLLLRFIYTCIIPHVEEPTVTFSDALINPQEDSDFNWSKVNHR